MTATIAVASEEFTYPVMAGFKWRRYFFGFNASALSSEPDRDGRRLRRVGAHDRRRRGVHRVPLPLRRDPRPRDRLAVDLHRAPRGPRVRHPAHGVRGIHRRRQGPVRARAALHLHADVPVLGHVLPARHAAAVAAVDRLGLAAVARDRARAVADLRAPDRAGDARRALRLPDRAHRRRLRRSADASSSGGSRNDRR